MFCYLISAFAESDTIAPMDKIRGIYEKVPGSGVWWIRYSDADGKLRREKAGRKSDASTLLAKRRTETLQRKKLPERFRSEAVTFADLCNDAIEHSESTNGSKASAELRSRVNIFLPVFGDRLAENIKKQDIVRWLTAEAKQRAWKASTVNRWQMSLSLIFRVALENEKITSSPASRIRQKKEDNGRLRYLKPDEEIRLKGALNDTDHVSAVDLALNTGMRLSEQFSLRWSQIDMDRKMLTLPKTKNGHVRHIPLNAVSLMALQRIGQGQHRDTDLLFSSPVFWSLKRDSGWFKESLRIAKIEDLTWHTLRHTFASRLVMAGVDLRTVAELLGHRSLQMVYRYSHLAPEHNADAVDRLVSVSGSVDPVIRHDSAHLGATSNARKQRTTTLNR